MVAKVINKHQSINKEIDLASNQAVRRLYSEDYAKHTIAALLPLVTVLAKAFLAAAFEIVEVLREGL